MLRDTNAKSIKPTDKPKADGIVVGLRLHPTKKKGFGKWKLRFSSPETGKRRDISFGGYPEVSITQARLLANQARSQIAIGIDPLNERVKAKKTILSEPNILTFKEAADKVHSELKDGWKNKKHQAQWINTLNTYVYPTMGDKALPDIEVVDIAEVLRPIWLNKVETATRVKQRIHQVMEWSCAQSLRVGNPVNGVQHLLPKQPSLSVRVQHHPAMPWRIIPNFVKDHIAEADNVSRALLLFVILTAVRSGEARHAHWTEFDLKQKVWTIPADRMKAKALHRVPLSKPVMKLLETQKKRSKHNLVFPSHRANNALTDMALTSFLRKHNAISDFPGRTATAHGFRSSFRDWASENSYARDLAERALAHTIKNAAEAAYHRTDLLDKRRDMMEAWADFITYEIATF